MSRTRVRRRRLGVGLVAVGAAVSLSGPVVRAIAPEQPNLVSRQAYTVRPGDTVWKIAQRVGSPGADPRPLVDEIVRQNGGATTLTPGETLSIPSA
jgi:Tfp pilus assembly protein FimV